MNSEEEYLLEEGDRIEGSGLSPTEMPFESAHHEDPHVGSTVENGDVVLYDTDRTLHYVELDELELHPNSMDSSLKNFVDWCIEEIERNRDTDVQTATIYSSDSSIDYGFSGEDIYNLVQDQLGKPENVIEDKDGYGEVRLAN